MAEGENQDVACPECGDTERTFVGWGHAAPMLPVAVILCANGHEYQVPFRGIVCPKCGARGRVKATFSHVRYCECSGCSHKFKYRGADT